MDYLVELRGRWYYRRRLPADIARHFPCSQLKRSLRTPKKATAKIFAAKLHAETERLFALIRMDMLTDAQIKQIVALYLAQSLDAEEARRNADRTPAEDALQEHGGVDYAGLWGSLCGTLAGVSEVASAFRQLAADYRQDLALGKLHYELVPNYLDSLLRAAGLDVPLREADRQRLTREIQKAHIDWLQIEAARTEGDYGGDLERRTLDRYGLPLTGYATAACIDSLALVLGRSKPTLAPTIPPDKITCVTLRQAVDKYLDWLTGKRRSLSTLSKYRQDYQLILELLGHDRYIASITRDELDQLAGRLQGLPSNRSTGRYRGIGLSQLENMDVPAKHRMALRTVNGYLKRVEGLFRYATEVALWLQVNPGKQLQIPLTQAEKTAAKKKPYTTDELCKLFDILPYTKKTPHKNWLCALALYTGARVGELAQLRVGDIKVAGEIAYIDFLVLDDGAEIDGRTLKNEASRRQTPIHPQLQELGFLRWVDQLRARGQEELFQALDSNAALKNYASWFSRFKTKFATNPRKVDFHSFRRTLTNALKQAGVPPHVYHAVIGHSEGKHAQEDAYTNPYDLGIQLEALTQVDFGLDVVFIKKRYAKLL